MIDAAAAPLTTETRFRWVAAAACIPMADGSAVVLDAAGDSHALNAEGAAAWRERPAWTVGELERWLLDRGCTAPEAAALAEAFLGELERVGLAERIESAGPR